jgi:hypothetical protein
MGVYFPSLIKDIQKDIESLRVAKIRLRLQRIESLLELDISNHLNQYDSLILDYFKPLNFNPADPNGYIPTVDKYFSELMLRLEEKNQNVSNFTIFRFYSLLELIKKENANKSNKK